MTVLALARGRVGVVLGEMLWQCGDCGSRGTLGGMW